MIPTFDPMHFDLRRLEAFAGGDAAFLQEMIEMFMESAAACRDDFVRNRDSEGQRQALHKLKGVALTVGADRLAALCAGTVTADTRAALDTELLAIRQELRRLELMGG